MTARVTEPAPSAADTGRLGRRRWASMIVLSLGVSLIIVDATIVNVLLPGLVTELDLSTSGAEWVASIYSLVFAALLIPFGRAGDLVGRRRMFLLGVGVFTAASLLAAAATGGLALIGARALQGVGAAMILPAALSTVTTVFTGRDRAVAFGLYGSTIGGMAALGPLLGGAVATSLGWRWAFAVNVPLGLALIVLARRLMPETREAGARGIDLTGGALAVAGLAALIGGLIEGQRYGWWLATSELHVGPLHGLPGGLSPVPIMLVAGTALLAVLYAVERARAAAGRPVMLDPALLRIRGFRRGALAAALVSVGELGLVFVLPLFLVAVHDDSPLQIGVAILPLALGAFAAGPYTGRLTRRHGAVQVVRLGIGLELLAVLAIAVSLRPGTTGLQLAPWMVLYGLGLGLASAQLTGVALAEVPAAQAGQASGTQSTMRQVGAALGIALIGTVFATGMGRAMTDLLRDTDVPAARHAAIAHELRDSAGTHARELSARPETASTARAARDSVAIAARHAMLATAAVLVLGLMTALRLGAPPRLPRARTVRAPSSDQNRR